MAGFVAAPGAIHGAAHGVGALISQVAGFERVATQASGSLSGRHPWGLLGEVYLRSECTELMEEFQTHLRLMRAAFEGAQERLKGTASAYSAAERATAEMLASLGAKLGASGHEQLRQLNPASRFYRDHRTLNGMIVALPAPFGSLGASVLDTVRLCGDLSSDDKYNIGTDLAMLGADVTGAGLATFGSWYWFRGDPLGFLILVGLFFLVHAFYWTKDAADWVTGDPVRIGQAAYNFDSIAEGCRKLARDFDGILKNDLGNDVWAGEAAEAARERLAALRDGIDATGRSADQVAAMLQLTSSIIACVEGLVIGIIYNLILWAVRIWFSAQLLAVETGGVSEAAAAARITTESAQTSIKVGRLIKLAARFMRYVAALMRRMVAALKDTQRRAFVALHRSSFGQKSLNYTYGVRFTGRIVRRDAGRGKHAKIELRHLFVSWWKQAKRSLLAKSLNECGLATFPVDKKGNDYPNGKWRISPIRHDLVIGGESRSISNYPGVFFIGAKTLLPFGRSGMYSWRAGDVAPAHVIDDKLDLWNAK